MSVTSAAKTLGDLKGWKMTNMEMQKLLYVAQIIHLGREGRPLFEEQFEAWPLGPVLKSLYHLVKGSGSGRVHPVGGTPFKETSSEFAAIQEAVNLSQGMSGRNLVNFAHRHGSAWKRSYVPQKRNIKITNQALLDEYRRDFMPSQAAIDWALGVVKENATSPAKYLDDTHERAFRERLRQDAARHRKRA